MKRCELMRATIFAIWALVHSATCQVSGQTPSAGVQSNKTGGDVARVRFTSGNSALKIPLDIDNNIILMQVRVNGSRLLKFIFDTGASHTILNSQREAELGLKSEGEVSGTATGGRIQGSYATGVSLSGSGGEVSNQLVALIPFPAVPGFEFDGTIGYDFINQFVIEIDYLKKTMNLYDPRTYAYKGQGGIIPLLLAGRRTPLVLAQITLEQRAPVTANLELDTGLDGTFVIYGPFANKHELLGAMPNAVENRARGAGGEQSQVLGQFKAVQLGQFTMKNPPAALTEAKDESDGIVGGEILRRFKVTLDYSRKRMILEPNKRFNDPYNIEKGDD